VAREELRRARHRVADDDRVGRIASRLRAVSTSVSPLLVLEVDPEMLTVSAESRFAAISNDVRVRVLFS
jgi:hypothetical protein